ncbi:alpha/beta hydrolase [Streptomyces sp. LN245]|uniref:alpha/beta hydrolase n=1 Tax=Streptomyces sp. LN245 TaxID=3112975 RepID=UPI00371CD885
MDFTDPDISIVNADLTGLPPTALHHGEYEALAGEGADFGRRLADFKILSEVRPLPEGQHSFIRGAGRGARARGRPGDRAVRQRTLASAPEARRAPTSSR